MSQFLNGVKYCVIALTRVAFSKPALMAFLGTDLAIVAEGN